MKSIWGVLGTESSRIAAEIESSPSAVQQVSPNCFLSPSTRGHIEPRRFAVGSVRFPHRANLLAALPHLRSVLELGSPLEVLLALYEEFETECIQHLRGPFAVAIAEGDTLFLARDRLGIQPMYYSVLPGKTHLLFATQIKMLLRCRQVSTEINPLALSDRYLVGYPIGNRTFLNSIQGLPPGSCATVSWEAGTIQMKSRRYFSIRETFGNVVEDPGTETVMEMLEAELPRAVAESVEGTSPLGVTLSGGLDSTIIAWVASRLQKEPLQTFTVADSADHVDAQLSLQCAETLGTSHHLIQPDPGELLTAAADCVRIEESPSSLTAFPIYLLSRTAAKSVSLCLSGDGADGLFGGYPQLGKGAAYLQPLEERIRKLKEGKVPISDEVSEYLESLKSARTLEEFQREMIQLNLEHHLVRNMELLMNYAAAFGLEMRFPFLNDNLMQFAACLPHHYKVNNSLGILKFALRLLAWRLEPRIPPEVLLRHKVGLPESAVLWQRQLAHFCGETIPRFYAITHPMRIYFKSRTDLLTWDLFQEILQDRRGNPLTAEDLPEFLREKYGWSRFHK